MSTDDLPVLRFDPGVFGCAVWDPECPQGHPIATPTDRRILWQLETTLAVNAPVRSTLRELGSELHHYLGDTCVHHWHYYDAEGDFPAHRQCLWCNDVEWLACNDCETEPGVHSGWDACTCSCHNTSEPPRECPVCGQRFAEGDLSSIHIAELHPEAFADMTREDSHG